MTKRRNDSPKATTQAATEATTEATIEATMEVRPLEAETWPAFAELVERARDRGPGDALPPVPLVNEHARDAPVRPGRRVLVVLAPVLDARQLLGAAVLAPALGQPVGIEDEGGVGAPGADPLLLGGAVVAPRL